MEYHNEKKPIKGNLNLTNKLLLILYGLLFIVGDTFTTYQALSEGAKELNPAISWLLPCWVCVLTLKTCIFVGFAYIVNKVNQKIALCGLIIVNLFMVFVVLNNHFHILRYPLS